MILRHRSLHRLIPWLGGILIVVSVFSLRHQYRYRSFLEIVDTNDLAYHLFYLITAALGVHLTWRVKRPFEPNQALWIAGSCFGMMTVLSVLEDGLFDNQYRVFGQYVAFATELLGTSTVPILWGCALVRCQDSVDQRSRKMGRALAILLTIVLALKFYAVVDQYYSWMSFLRTYLKPKVMATTTFRFLPTIFLLKAVIEEQLPVRDPQQAGRRARSVFWALLGWFVSHAGWWGYEVLYSMLNFQSFGKVFWSGLLVHDLILLIAVGTFVWLAKPEPEASTEVETA